MIEQFALNDEIMKTLTTCENKKQFVKAVKKAKCVKEGCLTWVEFLDFFFNKPENYLND